MFQIFKHKTVFCNFKFQIDLENSYIEVDFLARPDTGYQSVNEEI
jgi:hypothetical protein